MLHEKLTPPETKAHVSVARLTALLVRRVSERGARRTSRSRARSSACRSCSFAAQGGKAAALLDRCPHRNVPLSLGRVVAGGRLECAYHGWQFESERSLRARSGPARRGRARSAARRPPRCASKTGSCGSIRSSTKRPKRRRSRCPRLRTRATRASCARSRRAATLHATIENALDVPHTAFLHRGLFRGGKRSEIRATVRRSADRVEVQYDGEPRPSGVAGRVLSPGGGTVEHWDRFILPSVAQVEYRLGQKTCTSWSPRCARR